VAERGARLLVADDNKVNRLLLGRTLELQGHRISSADNGRRALEMLRAESFDLLLLDLEMPELDGFALLEIIAADDELREVPVIVTSSLEGVAHVARCIELGADDYLHKPVNPVLLKARVGSSLEKKRLRDQQKEQVKRFATSAVAQDLQDGGFALGGRRVNATVLFADLRGFTSLVESQSPEDTIELLNTWYTLMFDAISGQGGVVNQIIGDGLMAVFGAPLPLPEPGLAAVRAALDMAEMITLFNAERASEGRAPIAMGVGVASGEVIAGYTGTMNRATYTCVGDTVNLAARLEAHTKACGEAVLIDAATQAVLQGRVATRWRCLRWAPIKSQGSDRGRGLGFELRLQARVQPQFARQRVEVGTLHGRGLVDHEQARQVHLGRHLGALRRAGHLGRIDGPAEFRIDPLARLGVGLQARELAEHEIALAGVHVAVALGRGDHGLEHGAAVLFLHRRGQRLEAACGSGRRGRRTRPRARPRALLLRLVILVHLPRQRTECGHAAVLEQRAPHAAPALAAQQQAHRAAGGVLAPVALAGRGGRLQHRVEQRLDVHARIPFLVTRS
jgi:adenylate cyclase